MNRGPAPLWIIGLLVIVAGTGAWWVLRQPAAHTDIAQTKTYTSADSVIQFDYPANITVKPIVSSGDPDALVYPAQSVEIPDLFIVSRVPYADIAAQSPIFDYQSCCSGTRYWFDAAQNVWQAEDFEVQYKEPNKKTHRPLSTNGECDLQETFGAHKFYKIESGDEGVPTEFHYFLLTNKDYAIRFISQYDLHALSDTKQPSRFDVVSVGTQILSSVVLPDGVSEVVPHCL